MTRIRSNQQGRADDGAALAVRGTEQNASWRTSPWFLASVFGILALLLRFIYLLESNDNPFRFSLGLDPRNYHNWAQSILQGHPFGSGPFLQAPLYPHFLAACYAVLGIDPLRALWVQAFLGAGTTTIGAMVAYRYWGRRALITTGLLLALYKPAIFYTGILLVPTLATLLVALVLLATPRRPLLAGWLTGLTCLAHPTLLPGTLLVVLALATPKGRRLPSRRTMLTILAGVTVGILPATLYNLVRTGAFVAISANSGVNLYIGNGPESNGFYNSPFGSRGETDPCAIGEAGRLAGHPLDPVEANRFWLVQAADSARENPGRVARLVGGKFLAALGAFEVPQIENYQFEKRFSWLLRMPFLPNWIGLMALAATAIAWRPRDRVLWALAGAVVVTAAVLAAFFVTARFRLPAHLFLALGSGAAIAGMFRTQSHASRLRAAVVVGLVLVVVGPNWLGIHKEAAFGQCHYRLGIIAEREGRDTDAVGEYEAALKFDPRVARANINLGILRAREGDLGPAEELLLRGASLDPRNARAHLALGQIAEIRGEFGKACSLYTVSWTADSTFVRGLESLMAARYLMGEIETAARAAKELIRRTGRDPITVRAHFILQRLDERRHNDIPVRTSVYRARADLALAAGNPQAALGEYHRAVEHIAEDSGAVLELARLYNRAGQAGEADTWRTRFLSLGGATELLPRQSQ